MKIIVIGHISPDLDSIVSAIILAEFLNKKEKKNNYEAKSAGKLNQETNYILNYFGYKKPQRIKDLSHKKVFLVDHGEYEQSLSGIEKAEIVGVVDHHKMGGLKTALPIFYRSEALGSTSTILSKMFFENKIALTKKQAGMLLSGIISDTLNFTSPTSTLEDKRIAQALAKIAKENIKELADKILEIKSDISGISMAGLVKRDYKEFKAGKIKFAIGVFETINPRKINKEKVFNSLKKTKNKEKIDLLFFGLVDIIKKNTELFLAGEEEKEVAEKSFSQKSSNNVLFLEGVLSRKKQILPPLAKFLEKEK